MMLYLLFFSVVSHRILGVLSCIVLRYWLSNYQWSNDGKFDIHCAWASWRGFLDKNQVVFHDVIWHNPPEFTNTPYLYHAKEIIISFEWMDIYNWFFSNANVFVLREIIIDTMEMFAERCDDSVKVDNSFNYYAAMGIKEGVEDSENAKKLIDFFSSSRKKLMRTFGKNMMRAEKLAHASESDKSDHDKHGEDLDDVEDIAKSPHTNQQSEWRLDLHRLLILRLELTPPADLANNSSTDSSKNNLKVKSLFMRRKHLTGEPSHKRKDGLRKVLRWSRVLSKISDALVSLIVSHNPRALPTLLAKMGYNQTLNVAKSVVSLPLGGISTVSNTIGSMASHTSHAATSALHQTLKSVGNLTASLGVINRRRRSSKTSDIAIEEVQQQLGDTQDEVDVSDVVNPGNDRQLSVSSVGSRVSEVGNVYCNNNDDDDDDDEDSVA